MKVLLVILIIGAICIFVSLKITEPQKTPAIRDGIPTESESSDPAAEEFVFHKLKNDKVTKTLPPQTTEPKIQKCITDTDCKEKNPNIMILHEMDLKAENGINEVQYETYNNVSNRTESNSFSSDNINQLINTEDKKETERRAAREKNSDELLDLIDNLSLIQETVDKHIQNNR